MAQATVGQEANSGLGHRPDVLHIAPAHVSEHGAPFVNQAMDLGGATAARAAYGLGEGPPLRRPQSGVP